MGPDGPKPHKTVARCSRASTYIIIFAISSAVLFIIMWLLLCYFGFISIPGSSPQRRAIVNYQATTAKPLNMSSINVTSTPPVSSTVSSVNRDHPIPLRGNSRGEAQLAGRDAQSRPEVASTKGDFIVREKLDDTSEKHDRSKDTEKYSGSRGDDTRRSSDDSLSVRTVSASAPDNRPGHESTADTSKSVFDVETVHTGRSSSSRRGDDDDRRRPTDDDRRRPADDDRRKPADDDRRNPADDDRRRPVDDDIRRPADDDRRRPADDDRRRPVDDDRRRPADNDRPYRDDYERGRSPTKDREYIDNPPRRQVDDESSRRRRIEDDSSYERSSDKDTYRSKDREPSDAPRRRYDDYDDYDRSSSRKRPEDSGRRTDKYPPSRRYDDEDDYDRRPVPRRDDRYDRDDRTFRDDIVTRARDDGYRGTEELSRDKATEDSYRTRGDDKYIDRERPRTKVDDDSYRYKDEGRRRDDTVSTRRQDRDEYERGNPRIESETKYREPIIPRDEKRLPPRRDTIDDRDIESSRRSNRDEARGLPERTRADERYRTDDRIRDPISRDDDVDSFASRDRPRARENTRSDDSISETRRSRPRYDDETERDGYRSTEDDRNSRTRYDSRTSTSKGDDRLVDRDPPVRLVKDRELSKSVRPEDVILDHRSYSTSDDDYDRDRPRSRDTGDRDRPRSRDTGDRDRPLSIDTVDRDRPRSTDTSDREDKYRLDRRRTDDRDFDDRYERRTRDRYENDDDRSSDRRYPVLDSRDEDRTSRGQTERRSRDQLPPLRSDDRSESRDTRISSDTRTYRDDPRPSRVDEDRIRDESSDSRRAGLAPRREQSSSRSSPNIREKRYQESEVPCDDRSDKNCNTESVETKVSNERPLTPKEIIDAANRRRDMPDRPDDATYPVYDPRINNMTSPEVIRPNERKGITISTRKRKK